LRRDFPFRFGENREVMAGAAVYRRLAGIALAVIVVGR
jgi:hypothetical protein